MESPYPKYIKVTLLNKYLETHLKENHIKLVNGSKL